ncbi:hypothetical protein ZOSMA_19G00490 [Zostera marina]|uniref:Uncharacterized protein n=1 Tax=Zostera marina TaxID=29655 RepID=A0A0K9PQG3_ZOSMR|nr:hypothetical protein ZOSMA_19G00490 [Zostera marina]
MSDDVTIDDSNPVEGIIPIIGKPSTSIKRHKFKKTNSISFEGQCSYLKHIPQRVFHKGYVRGYEFAMVKDVFKSVVQSMNYEKENINDICRLWFCLLCSCFLTPTSKK